MNSVIPSIADAPFRPVKFAPVDINIERRPDGSITLSSGLELVLREQHLPAYLRRHAKARPDRVWLAQRRPKGGDWFTLSFAQGLEHINKLTQGLLDLNLQAGSTVAILSANSIEHALMTIACMQARLVVAPISVAYSLQSTDYTKLKEVFKTIEPSAIFVQNGKQFETALKHVSEYRAVVIAIEDRLEGHLDYKTLATTPITIAVEASVAAIDPKDTARIMFTSGSTGTPKGVPGTHKAIVVTVESNLKTNGNQGEGEMVRLDWLPWNHVFGATGLALTIVAGGTFYIDDGRPMGPLFKETLRNLNEVSPTNFSSVPAAYAVLVDALENDDKFAAGFFKKINVLAYGGASLPADIVGRLQTLSIKHIGAKTPIATAYGATETGPGGAFIYWPTDRTGLIGLPHAGFELKLMPLPKDRYELRVRGEAVTKGYYGRPDLNAEIFDDEGFYKIGDTVTLADPNNILDGLVFAGRLSEEFKLTTGTFVLVGSLRLKILAKTAPLITEVVLCGENQAFIGVMAWLNIDVARKIAKAPNASREELNLHAEVVAAAKACFAIHNESNPGLSSQVKRFILLDEPPSIDRGEITDKGSINQRGVQQHRNILVQSLFANALAEHVIDVDDSW